eukprot:2262307-Rhodomonas_salina.2
MGTGHTIHTQDTQVHVFLSRESLPQSQLFCTLGITHTRGDYKRPSFLYLIPGTSGGLLADKKERVQIPPCRTAHVLCGVPC